MKRDFKNWDSICRKPTNKECLQINSCLENYYHETRKLNNIISVVSSILSLICLLKINYWSWNSILFFILSLCFCGIQYWNVQDKIKTYSHLNNTLKGNFEVVEASILQIEEDLDTPELVSVMISHPQCRLPIGPFQIKSMGVSVDNHILILKFPNQSKQKYFAFTEYMLQDGTYLENRENELIPSLEIEDNQDFVGDSTIHKRLELKDILVLASKIQLPKFTLKK